MSHEPFQSSDIEGIVKKAKRKSVIRNIVISTILVLVLGALFIIINGQVVNKAHNKAIEANSLLFKISQPNVQTGGGTFNYGILSGTYTYNKYKLIDDRVVPWGQDTLTFNAWGHNNKSSAIAVYDESRVGKTGEEYRNYNTTNGQRAMLFYHPSFEYDAIQNDLELIQQAPDDALMEVAISFDESFSVKEIQKEFKLHNQITWYCVDQYNQIAKEELKGSHESGDSSSFQYGFSATVPKEGGDAIKEAAQNEEDFLSILEELKSTGNYDFLIDQLIESTKQNMKDGLVIGVVVTGTKEELLKLREEEHVRAISLGAVAREF